MMKRNNNSKLGMWESVCGLGLESRHYTTMELPCIATYWMRDKDKRIPRQTGFQYNHASLVASVITHVEPGRMGLNLSSFHLLSDFKGIYALCTFKDYWCLIWFGYIIYYLNCYKSKQPVSKQLLHKHLLHKHLPDFPGQVRVNSNRAS